MISFTPQWHPPASIRSVSTFRKKGGGFGRYSSLNLSYHVGDIKDVVDANRKIVRQKLALPKATCWGEAAGQEIIQVIDEESQTEVDACALITHVPNKACALLTNDEVPLLFASKNGDEIAALGFSLRTLRDRFIEKFFQQFRNPPEQLLVWMGPSLCARHTFPTIEQKQYIEKYHSDSAPYFFLTETGDYTFDLKGFLRYEFQQKGIPEKQITQDARCTLEEESHFFSKLRNEPGATASILWIEYKMHTEHPKKNRQYFLNFGTNQDQRPIFSG